jgi:hypothetical protein
MFKKGSPLVQGCTIAEADRKHKAALTNREKGLSHKLPNLRLNWNPKENWIHETLYDWAETDEQEERHVKEREIKDLIDRLVCKLFPANSFESMIERASISLPSTSAHSETGTSRMKGGAVNYLKPALIPDFNPNPSIEKIVELPTGDLVYHYQHTFERAAEKIAEMIDTSEYVAEPVYLQEPLKIRTITKGPSAPYFLLIPFQKFLWKRLLTSPLFSLIGEPITAENLNSMLPSCGGKVGKWLSGDYSGATDNLVRWLSKYILQTICLRTGVPDEFYRVCKRSLIAHKLRYADMEVLQQNGQLMGSPLSFPILCLANAAICILSYEKSFLKVCPLDELPTRINGDDCINMYSEMERERWEDLAEFIGMTPSPGKCYYAENWLQMNSELFVLRGGQFRYIPFINFSLASEYQAKGGQKRSIESLSQTMLNFVDGHTSRIDIWLRRMAPVLKRDCPALISWFLPQCLGGLGLISKDLSGKCITAGQLRMATKFYINAIAGIDAPYEIKTLASQKANYQLLSLKKYEKRVPVFSDKIPVKEYWSDRFFREKKEEQRLAPLLWENLVEMRELRITKGKEHPLVGKKVRALYKGNNTVPGPLEALLTLRSVDVEIDPKYMVSTFEPKGLYKGIIRRLELSKRDSS